MNTIPREGDVIAIQKRRHNPELPWECRYSSWHWQVGCNCNLNEVYAVEFTVEKVIYFADNSIEAHGHLEDGTRYSEMLVAPHGDACF
jgi:hypothetical protein